MRSNVAEKLGCLVVGSVAGYSLVHRSPLDSWPGVETDWTKHARQLMGPSGTEE